MFILIILETKFSLFLNIDAMKTYWWGGGKAQHIFHLGTRQVWSGTLVPLNLPQKECPVSTEDSMCRPQCHYRHGSAEANPSSLVGSWNLTT